MDEGRSMRAVKDSPVTRLFRSILRTGGRGANKIRISTARGSRTIKQCSFDQCSEGHSASCPLVLEQFKEAMLCRSA